MITIQMYFVYCSCKTLNIINSLLGPNRIKINLSSNVHMTHCTFLARKWRPQTKAQSPTHKTRRCMTWHCADWPCCPPGLKGSWNWLVEPQVDLLFYGHSIISSACNTIHKKFTGLKVGEMLTQCYEEYFGMIFFALRSYSSTTLQISRLYTECFRDSNYSELPPKSLKKPK